MLLFFLFFYATMALLLGNLTYRNGYAIRTAVWYGILWFPIIIYGRVYKWTNNKDWQPKFLMKVRVI